MHKQSKKISIAILGATGLVGQTFVSLLAKHPWFEISMLVASSKNRNISFSDACDWILPISCPEKIKDIKLSELDISQLQKSGIKYIFSALPPEVAKDVEPKLREKGFYVFTNASALRYDKNVSIIIPEINAHKIETYQYDNNNGTGFVVSNSNCTTSGLALAVAPLIKFDIKKVIVSTYQALSGSGYPGIPSLSIVNNLIPYIQDEEDKIEYELNNILNSSLDIISTAVRVPVLYGHLMSVCLEVEKVPNELEIIDEWNKFSFQLYNLPSLPNKPIQYFNQDNSLRSQLVFTGDPIGMTVFVSRLKCKKNMIRFIVLVNNLIRGAAGGSIANAELHLISTGGI